MIKKYNSHFFDSPIIVENIDWEIIVKIITKDKKEVIYSLYDLVDKTSYSPYIKNAILASFIWEIPKNILVIWFWAGSYAKYFKDYLWEKINITWIEIDEAMIEIAKNKLKLKNINYFNLDYIKSLEILNNKKNKKFDIIFFDIYDENSKIPKNFNNLKTIKLIKNILDKNWKFIVNFANTKENKSFYEEIQEKILEIFPKNKIEILNDKNDNWNIIWVYNLEKKLNSESLILEYLQKVQDWKINYDSNLIKNIFLK